MSLISWFDASEATKVGVALADHFTLQSEARSIGRGNRGRQGTKNGALEVFLRRAEREVKPLNLNFYKKAKLANSFKWRLMEKGVATTAAAEVTQTLVMHLSMNRLVAAVDADRSGANARPSARSAEALLSEASRYMAQGAFSEAIEAYRSVVEREPRNSAALNNLGVALCKTGLYSDAEPYLRSAIGIKPNYSDAHSNLASVLRMTGRLALAEASYRRALKQNRNHIEALTGLGAVLFSLGNPKAAKEHVAKVLAAQPTNAAALLLMGQIAGTEGRFEEAESLFKRVLEKNPEEPSAWTGLAGLRRMTVSDQYWLERAEQILSRPLTSPDRVNLQFAIGKYCDDTGNYAKAFRHFEQANRLMKATVPDYDQAQHAQLVDDLIQAYAGSSGTEQSAIKDSDACRSQQPVFVVGMPRSGTSLIEQIIASHPGAAGAGELLFWAETVQKRESALRRGPMPDCDKTRIAEAYLRTLGAFGSNARRIVDKAPANSHYLGVIHSVFPNARIIYSRRHPIDTCLSCYFQQFPINFTMDLGDLAHYYRMHEKLMKHWQSVLPPHALMEVPYEELVADQEAWTRRILKFIGLEWDEKCLRFHETRRNVATASAWQVRQKIYTHSVERWRNYEKFLGPLSELQQLR